MSFLIDTDICSALMRGNGKVFNRFIQYAGGLYITTVTLAELNTFVHRASAPPRREETFKALLRDVSILDLNPPIAEYLGRLRAALMDQGINVPTADFINGATALYHNYSVVTHNVRDYALVPNLRIEDWTL